MQPLDEIPFVFRRAGTGLQLRSHVPPTVLPFYGGLMHAVVSNVSIQAGQFEAARKMLSEEVVPRIRKAPGFVKGYWTVSNDSMQGTSMTIFQTKQDAESALAMIRSANPAPGVTFDSVEVREVVAEA